MRDSKCQFFSLVGALLLLPILFTVPASAANPDRPTVQQLAQVPSITQPQLSQTGKWLAVFAHVRGERMLAVENLDKPGNKPFIVNGPKWRLNWFSWLVDDRLLLSVSTPETIQGTPVTVTRLVMVDPSREKVKTFFRRETGRAMFQIHDRIVSLMPNDPNHVLINLNPNNATKPQVRKANLKRLSLSNSTVQNSLPGVHNWQADALGNVRVGYGFTSDQKQPVFKAKTVQGDWRDFPNLAQQSGFRVLAIPSHQPDLLYVNSDHEHPLGALYEFDVSTGKFGRMLAQNDSSAISRVQLNHTGNKLEAVFFESELVPAEYFEPWLKSFNQQLAKLLPDTHNRLISVPENRKRAIIYSYASDQAPHFYIYQAEKKSLSFLTSAYPQLEAKQLAKTLVTSYPARDGLTIPAYLTLPAGATLATANKLPFVVLPHGGPHARDFLRFDWLTQTMAVQGYGVLQMNFRGSTGYGAEFFEAGKQQWGQAMQDDITDGTRWLIEQGWADEQDICIAGGSYGGYAALMGAVKEPNLYQCAISLNGVTDLPMLLSRQRRYIGGRFFTRFIGNLWRDRASLRTNSPARRAADIHIPILLVQGEDDRVVNKRQAQKMRAALKAAGADHEYLELPKGDHFLTKQSNRQAFAAAATEFLSSHLKQ